MTQFGVSGKKRIYNYRTHTSNHRVGGKNRDNSRNRHYPVPQVKAAAIHLINPTARLRCSQHPLTVTEGPLSRATPRNATNTPSPVPASAAPSLPSGSGPVPSPSYVPDASRAPQAGNNPNGWQPGTFRSGWPAEGDLVVESSSAEPNSVFIIPDESVVGEHVEISCPPPEFDVLMFREHDEIPRSPAGCDVSIVRDVENTYIPPRVLRL